MPEYKAHGYQKNWPSGPVSEPDTKASRLKSRGNWRVKNKGNKEINNNNNNNVYIIF